MNRSFAYGLAGAVLAGVAYWAIRNYREGEPLQRNPLEEMERMMAQTRKKVQEIQRNFDEFQDTLTKAALEPSQHPLPARSS